MSSRRFYNDHGSSRPSDGPDVGYGEAPTFTVTPDNTVGSLAYCMTREADNARIASERLMGFTQRAFARQAAMDADASKAMGACQDSLRKLIERLDEMTAELLKEADQIAAERKRARAS